MCGVQGKQLFTFVYANKRQGKGREMTKCLAYFVSMCQVVSDSEELGVRHPALERYDRQTILEDHYGT